MIKRLWGWRAVWFSCRVFSSVMFLGVGAANADNEKGCLGVVGVLSPTAQEQALGHSIVMQVDIQGRGRCSSWHAYRIREEWNDLCDGKKWCDEVYDSGWLRMPAKNFTHTVLPKELAHNLTNIGHDICSTGQPGVKTWLQLYVGCAEGTCELAQGIPTMVCLYESCENPGTAALVGPVSVIRGERAEYQSSSEEGAVYTWSVIGGQILEGGSSSKVVVEWMESGRQSITTVIANDDWCKNQSRSLFVEVGDASE